MKNAPSPGIIRNTMAPATTIKEMSPRSKLRAAIGWYLARYSVAVWTYEATSPEVERNQIRRVEERVTILTIGESSCWRGFKCVPDIPN